MSTIDINAALKRSSDPCYQYEVGELAAALLLARDALTSIATDHSILGGKSKQAAKDALSAIAELPGTDRDRLRHLADQFFSLRASGDLTRPFLRERS